MPRPKSTWFLPSQAQIKFMGVPVEFDLGMGKNHLVMIHKIGPMSFLNPKRLGVITDISEPKEDHSSDEMSYVTMDEMAPLIGAELIPYEEVKPKVYHTSKKQDWGTPQALYNLLAEEYPFTLDVCADQYNAKCPDFLTEAMDALALDWWGVVWMNPPYNETKAWVEKLIHEVDCGHVERGVALVGARPDTEWFWYASMYASEIRFLKGRLKFEIQIPHPEGEYTTNTTGLTLVGIDMGKKVTTYVTDAAPFPSCLLIFDRSQTQRKVLWWDWKQKIQTQYAYQPLEKKDMVGVSPSQISKKAFSADLVEALIKEKKAEMEAKIQTSMHPPQELKEALGKALAEQIKAMQGDSELAQMVLKHLGWNPVAKIVVPGGMDKDPSLSHEIIPIPAMKSLVSIEDKLHLLEQLKKMGSYPEGAKKALKAFKASQGLLLPEADLIWGKEE